MKSLPRHFRYVPRSDNLMTCWWCDNVPMTSQMTSSTTNLSWWHHQWRHCETMTSLSPHRCRHPKWRSDDVAMTSLRHDDVIDVTSLIWCHCHVIKFSLRMTSLMTQKWRHWVTMTSFMMSSGSIEVARWNLPDEHIFKLEEAKLLSMLGMPASSLAPKQLSQRSDLSRGIIRKSKLLTPTGIRIASCFIFEHHDSHIGSFCWKNTTQCHTAQS